MGINTIFSNCEVIMAQFYFFSEDLRNETGGSVERTSGTKHDDLKNSQAYSVLVAKNHGRESVLLSALQSKSD